MYAPNSNILLDLALQVFVHMLTVSGIALAAAGGSNLANAPSSNDISHDIRQQETGYVLLLVVLVILVLYAAHTLRRASAHTSNANTSTNKNSSALHFTHAVCLALVFVAIRVLYSVAYAFSRSSNLNPVTGTFAVKFILIFLAQLIAALCLLVGGILDRDIAKKSECPDYVSVENVGLTEADLGRGEGFDMEEGQIRG
jgi:cytochrome bd-type quinol oxidase subunit 2